MMGCILFSARIGGNTGDIGGCFLVRVRLAHGQMFHISPRGKGLRDRTCVQPRVPDVDCMDSTIKPKTQLNQQFVDQGHRVETKKW